MVYMAMLVSRSLCLLAIAFVIAFKKIWDQNLTPSLAASGYVWNHMHFDFVSICGEIRLSRTVFIGTSITCDKLIRWFSYGSWEIPKFSHNPKWNCVRCILKHDCSWKISYFQETNSKHKLNRFLFSSVLWYLRGALRNFLKPYQAISNYIFLKYVQLFILVKRAPISSFNNDALGHCPWRGLHFLPKIIE